MSPPSWFPYAPGAARAWVERQGPWRRALYASALPRPLDVSPARGRAWFPVAVDHPDLSGFLLEIRVSHRTPTVEAEVDAETCERVRAWLARLTGIGAGGLPPVRFVRTVLPEGFPVTGRSLEMAATVAWVSDLLGRAPLAPVVVSGTALEGAWGGVDRLEQKAAVCGLEAPGVVSELLSEAREPNALLERWFGPDWQSRLAEALQVHASATASQAWDAFLARDFPGAAALAQRALQQGAERRDAALCLWIRGAWALHAGQSAEAHRRLDEAAVRLRALNPILDLCEDHEAEELEAFLGIALVDLGRPSMAASRLQVVSERLLAPHPGRRRRIVCAQVLGSLARARVMTGDLDEAALLLASSDAGWAPEWERCRVRMDLAEVHRRRGDAVEQRAALRAAREMIPWVLAKDRERTYRFLELYEARAGLGSPRPVEGAPDWNDWPQPAEAAEHLLATDPQGLDRWLARHLEAAQGVEGFVLLGAAARRAMRSGSVPEEVARAARRLAEGEIDGVVRGALVALAEGEPGPWVRQCPY